MSVSQSVSLIFLSDLLVYFIIANRINETKANKKIKELQSLKLSQSQVLQYLFPSNQLKLKIKSKGIPYWKYITTPGYKRFDNASLEIFNISKKFIDKAKENMIEMDNKSDDDLSVLQKLIKRCGSESQIPLGMLFSRPKKNQNHKILND